MDLARTTQREHEVFDLLGAHLTHEQIGQQLFISVRTVESHVASLRRKLDAADHRTLVRLAIEHRSETDTGRSSPPVPLTSFVGRQRESADLTSALESARLVSAVGPGGAGKTRLALSVAAATGARFASGVRWVDLAPISDETGLDEAVAQACSAVPTSRRGPVEAVVAALGDRPTLVVFDNCEHLVNAVAVLAERVLTACAGVTVLVTSRLRLAVGFERVFPVLGLSTDPDGDAVALFVERAIAAGAPTPMESERERISEVCRALDGLPLAVELAAVRMPALSLEGVERGLLNQGDLLTGGARAVSRHRSMTETLDWSVRLLGDTAGRALHRLAVFVTPFDLDGAAAIAGFASVSPADVPAALYQLTEHNLVMTATVGQRRVYRMLETVRQHSIATMAPEDELAFSHHFAWCLHSAEHLLAGAPSDAGPQFAAEARAALAWSMTHEDADLAADLARTFGLLLFHEGRLQEAQARLERAAELGSDPARAAADLQNAAAVAKCRVSGDEALRLEVSAADRARAAREPVTAALALARAAELLTRFPGMFGGPPVSNAEAFVAQARALAPRDSGVAAAVEVAAAGYAARDSAPKRKYAQRALAAARKVRDPILESSALDALIAAELFCGEVMTAYTLAKERVERLRSLGTAVPAAGLELKDALHVATFCALGAGDLDTARAMARAQHDLPYLRESRDVADDELMAPAVLSGDLRTAVEVGERFMLDWIEAGRPRAAGRALAPAAVALAHGLLGDRSAREEWLAVVAEIRGVPRADATRGTGYGELFEAMVLMRADRPEEAFDVLTADGDRGLYGAVFSQWTAALIAEAASVSGRGDADQWVRAARSAAVGNPMATATIDRAVSQRPLAPRHPLGQ